MISVIIAAAGRGTRLKYEKNKIFLNMNGKPILQYSLELFSELEDVSDIIVVTSAEDVDEVNSVIRLVGCGARVVIGGKERQDSVYSALQALSADTDYVLVHDGARPFVEKNQVMNLIDCVKELDAAILAVPVKDTIKVVDKQAQVVATPERSTLVAVQTPQGFSKKILVSAYEYAYANSYRGTDDASIVEYYGKTVHVVTGDYENIKITTPEDILVGCELLNRRNGTTIVMKIPRIGFGYDVHQLVNDRSLILGGMEIPHEFGLLGHSDADVLLHAISDALLGAAALGDIGKHFPDTDAQFKGADSLILLQRVVELIAKSGLAIHNIDATVAAQQPKLSPFIPVMRGNIASACGIDISVVSVKATTTEELGFVGRKEGISAYAIVSVI